jgi:asparagine synthase (glutamine-hydrolysing)
MCGIALIAGSWPGADLFGHMLDALAPRGESEETVCDSHLLAGVQRLKIIDRERAVQPWQSTDGRWLLCYNGEIFNYRQLRAELMWRRWQFRTESDTELALAAFGEWGEEAVGRFRGEFALAIADRATGRIYLARDPVGVKPLYWSCRDGRLHVASEVKALVPVGAPISEVPPGHHGWAEPRANIVPRGKARSRGSVGPIGMTEPALRPYADLSRLGADQPPIEDPAEAAKALRWTVEDSVRVRVDTDLTVGVILSGGLDSSIVLANVLAMHPDCVALTIGAPGSDDLAYSRRLCADLRVPHEVIDVQPGDIRAADIREAIRMSELTEYGDIINAVVSVPLFARAQQLGIKVVLTGDGSDELFAGYPMYEAAGAAASRRLFLHVIRNLHRTELQRVDRVSMGNGVEARVPYLDPEVVELAMRLPLSLKVRHGQEKWIMRQAFADVLPDYILRRPKNPMSHSSGLHERARLYRARFARMHRSFGYDLLEPVRRDFSVVLDRCDLDIDRAIAATTARRDYTAAEHARDLAGALRWNTAAALGHRASTARHRRQPGQRQSVRGPTSA